MTPAGSRAVSSRAVSSRAAESRAAESSSSGLSGRGVSGRGVSGSGDRGGPGHRGRHRAAAVGRRPRGDRPRPGGRRGRGRPRAGLRRGRPPGGRSGGGRDRSRRRGGQQRRSLALRRPGGSRPRAVLAAPAGQPGRYLQLHPGLRPVDARPGRGDRQHRVDRCGCGQPRRRGLLAVEGGRAGPDPADGAGVGAEGRAGQRRGPRARAHPRAPARSTTTPPSALFGPGRCRSGAWPIRPTWPTSWPSWLGPTRPTSTAR